MPADTKTLERVQKLLRLAAPSSGTTDAERASAALEAARLIEENDVEIGGRSLTPEPRLSKPRSQPAGPLYNVWVVSVAAHNRGCVACGGVISADDIVLVRVNERLEREYKHRYAPCGSGTRPGGNRVNHSANERCAPIPTAVHAPLSVSPIPSAPAGIVGVCRISSVGAVRAGVIGVSRVVRSGGGVETRVEL